MRNVVQQHFDDLSVGICSEHPLRLNDRLWTYGLGNYVDTGRDCDICGEPITSQHLDSTCLECMYLAERAKADAVMGRRIRLAQVGFERSLVWCRCPCRTQHVLL